METIAAVVEWIAVLLILAVCSTPLIHFISAIRADIQAWSKHWEAYRFWRCVRKGKAGI